MTAVGGFDVFVIVRGWRSGLGVPTHHVRDNIQVAAAVLLKSASSALANKMWK